MKKRKKEIQGERKNRGEGKEEKWEGDRRKTSKINEGEEEKRWKGTGKKWI